MTGTLATAMVDWATIGEVVAVAIVAGIVVTGSFSVAILGTTRSMECRRAGHAVSASVYALMGLAGALVTAGAIAGAIFEMTMK